MNPMDRATEWLNTAATRSLQQVLREMCGEAPAVSVVAGGSIDDADFLWWGQRLDDASGPGIWTGAGTDTWMSIGRRALEYAGLEQVQDTDARDTFIEIVKQWSSEIAHAVAVKLKQQSSGGSGKEQKPPATAARHKISVRFPDGATHVVLLAAEIEMPAPLVNAPARTEDRAPVVSPFVPATVPSKSKTLDLLLEVELPVSVSFGRAELPLKDVLKLTSGSILELNRGVSEPVDIIVNNCAIARGEVVVVDGNYGVRIQQIISRQERMRTLR